MPALHSRRISAVRCCVCCAVALTCGLLLSSTCSIAPCWLEPEPQRSENMWTRMCISRLASLFETDGLSPVPMQHVQRRPLAVHAQHLQGLSSPGPQKEGPIEEPWLTRWDLASISAAQVSKASYTSRIDTSCAMYLAVKPRRIFTTPAVWRALVRR